MSETRIHALVKLLDGPQTRADLGLDQYNTERMIAEGFIQTRRVLRSERRGRPAHIYALTSKGRSRAKRLAVAA